MAIKINGTTVIGNDRSVSNVTDITASGDVDFSSSNYINAPSGTTGERPASPSSGYIRFNTDISSLEQYDGNEWKKVGAPEGGSLINSLPVDASSISVSTGDIISYNSSNCTAAKTLGDPSFKRISGDESRFSVYSRIKDPNTCFRINKVCTPPIGYNELIRTGQNNFFRITKGAPTLLTENGAETDDYTDVLISCWGTQNLEFNDQLFDVVPVDTGFFTDCPSSTDPTVFDSNQYDFFKPQNVPYNSGFQFNCCEETDGLSVRVQPIPESLGIYTIDINEPNFDINCQSMRIDPGALPTALAHGSMSLFSCDDSSVYHIVPTPPDGNGGGGDWEGNFCMLSDNLVGGVSGIQLYKFDYCSGTDRLCTIPSRYECNTCAGWNIGNINRSGTLMYGEFTKPLCHCCGTSETYFGCGYLFARTIDDNFDLSIDYGCVTGTDRTFLYAVCNFSDSFSDQYSGGQKKFWPGTEDQNGWVLYTEPVTTIDVQPCQVNVTGSYLKVGAVKPISTGCIIESSNVVCVCHDAALDGAFCIAGWNGVCGCQFDCIPCNFTNAIGGGCNPGDPFGCFTYFHNDVSKLTSDEGHNSSMNGGYPAFAYIDSTAPCFALPQATIVDGYYSSSNNYSSLSFLSFWDAGCSNYKIPVNYSSSYQTLGENIVKFQVDDSTCQVSLICCTNSFADITNIVNRNASCDQNFDGEELYESIFNLFDGGDDGEDVTNWEFYLTKYSRSENRLSQGKCFFDAKPWFQPLQICGGNEFQPLDLVHRDDTCLALFCADCGGFDGFWAYGPSCFTSAGFYTQYNNTPIDAYRYEIINKNRKFSECNSIRYDVGPLNCLAFRTFSGINQCDNCYCVRGVELNCAYGLFGRDCNCRFIYNTMAYMSGSYDLDTCFLDADVDVTVTDTSTNICVCEDRICSFYSIVNFLPQRAYTVGSNCAYLFIEQGTDDGLGVSVASGTNQNNINCAFAIANTSGGPGDVIGFADIHQGVVPISETPYSGDDPTPDRDLGIFYSGSVCPESFCCGCYSSVFSRYDFNNFGIESDYFDNSTDKQNIYLCEALDSTTGCRVAFLKKEFKS